MNGAEDSDLIAAPQIFREPYVPPEIADREEQINKLTVAVRSARRHRKPMHCWLYGSPDTGKSVVLTGRTIDANGLLIDRV